MDEDLYMVLNTLLNSCQGDPLGDDNKRTVNADDLDALRQYLKHYELGGGHVPEEKA